MPKSDLINVLQERGFVHQSTNLEGLDARCAEGPITGYIGFDLTADSLHVGSMVQLMVLRWMEKLGHQPLVLLGRGTTMIGDPTGKTAARPMLSAFDIQTNELGIRTSFHSILKEPIFVYNDEWFRRSDYLDFLRKYGPHFSVGRMLTFDSVKTRLENDSLSFLEFNYMILQSVDFSELMSRRGCELQIGGSDQWGNIVSGVDLCRRLNQQEAFGLTTPLFTNTAGEKMGKTAGGAVWLNFHKTATNDFWQFWRNVEDAKVVEYLKLFTELPMDQIARLGALQGSEINEAKKVLASAVTTMVHGSAAAQAAELIAASAFEARDNANLPEVTAAAGQCLADVLVGVGWVKSKGEADRLAAQAGVKVEGEAVASVRDPLTAGSFVLTQGKKRVVRVTVA